MSLAKVAPTKPVLRVRVVEPAHLERHQAGVAEIDATA